MSIFKRIRTKALSLGAAAALAVGGALVASPAQAAMAFTIHANVNIESSCAPTLRLLFLQFREPLPMPLLLMVLMVVRSAAW